MYKLKIIQINNGLGIRYAVIMEHVFNGVTYLSSHATMEELREYYEEDEIDSGSSAA